MTTLIVVRHGFSLSNAERRYTGQQDIALSPEGFAQAELVADYLCANLPPDAVYSSDLCRAMDTVVPTANRLGLTVIPDVGLRETDVGRWTGRVYEEVCETEKTYMDRHRADPDVPCPDGESRRQVFDRVTASVRRILNENEGKTVLLATHAMPARCIECYAAGGDATRVSDYKVSPNAAIHIYTFEDGHLHSAGPNIVSHLEKPGEKLPSDLV